MTVILIKKWGGWRENLPQKDKKAIEKSEPASDPQNGDLETCLSEIDGKCDCDL